MQRDRHGPGVSAGFHFECPVCHYAMHVPGDQEKVREERECRACGSQMNPAMNWMRPPGFASGLHRSGD